MSSKKGFSGLDDLSSDIDDILNENHKDINNTIEEKTESKDDKTNFSNNETVDSEKTSSTTPNTNKASTVTNNDSNNGSSSWIWWVIAVGVIGWIILQSNITTSSSGKTSYSSASQQNYSSSTQSNNYSKTTSDDYYESKPDAYLSILNKNQLLYCEAEKIRLDAVQNEINLYSSYEIDKYNSLSNDYNSRCANKQYYKNDMYYVDRNIKNKKYQLEKEGLDRFFTFDSDSLNQKSSTLDNKNSYSKSNEKRYESARSEQECLDMGMYPYETYSDGSVLCSKENKKNKKSSTLDNKNSYSKSNEKRYESARSEQECLDMGMYPYETYSDGSVLCSKENKKNKKSSTLNLTNNVFTLTIKTAPIDAKIQILNIKEIYYDGIKLKKGKYNVKVSKDGYETINKLISLDKDIIYDIELSKIIIDNSKFSSSTQKIDNNSHTVNSYPNFNSQKPDMSKLTSEQRNAIESNCGWKNNSYGPAEYYKCIKTQMNQLGSSQKPDMSKLTSEQRNAIESNCGWKNNSYGPAEYYKCIKTQMNQLGSSQKPDMSKLTSEQRNAIESNCGWKNNSYGPAEYYKCIKTQMNQLGSSQKPDMSKLTSEQRNAIESNCGWKNNSYGPAEYYKCIKTQMNQLGSSQKPDMSKLTSEQRNAIESNCGWKNNSYGPAEYYKCIKTQMNQLGSSQKPDMSKLTSEQRNAIESNCGWKNNSYGPAEYYKCIKTQMNQFGYKGN